VKIKNKRIKLLGLLCWVFSFWVAFGNPTYQHQLYIPYTPATTALFAYNLILGFLLMNYNADKKKR